MRAPDQGVRDRIVAARHTSLVVEAGAGTGKTTLLVDRVLGLIEAGAPVSRLAVITFTRKAAAELVARLGARLAAARDDGHAWAARALADLELADVGTTDAFCRRILEAFPLQAEVPPGFTLADEIAQVALREEAWTRFLEAGGEDGAAWLALLRELGGRTVALRRLADALLENRDLSPATDPAPEAPDPARVFEEHLAPVVELVPLCRDPEDRLLRHVQVLVRDGRIARALGGSAAERVLLHLRGSTGRYTRKLGRKDAWSGRKDDVIAALERLDEAMDRVISIRSTGLANEVALRLAGYAAEYEHLKRHRGLLDFRDLALRTRDLLVRRPDVRRLIASRWDAILLDEVQDTDPLQMEIAFLLASDEPAADPLDSRIVPGKLFLVGDPKQSIYRFRRADIELYEHAKRQLAAQGEAPEIVANFRSDPEIVDAVNQVFDGWMEPPPDGAWQAHYVPLIAAREPETPASPDPVPAPGAREQLDLFAAAVRSGRAAEPAGRVSLLLTDPAPDPRTGDARGRLPSAEERGELERDACARAVRRILGRDGAGPGWRLRGREARPEDIAVLVRRIAWGDLFLESLRRAGVPASISGGRRFFAREEIQTLQAIVDVLLDPDDRLAMFAALRSPAIGISDDNLVLRFSPQEDEQPADVRDAEQRLRSLAERARSLSVPELLETAAEELALLPVFGFRPDGAARVEAIRLLLEAADSLAEAGYDSLPSFARWLREQDTERPGPGDDEPGDLEGVSILTMHKAKGLEFPVVILADLAGRTAGQLDVVPDRARGRLEFRLSGAAVRTAGFDRAEKIEKQRHDAEEIRLLYVAMTRARERLVLCWPEAGAGHLHATALPARLGVLPGTAAPAGGTLSTLRAGDWPALESRGRVHRVDPAGARAAAPPADDWPALRERARGDLPVVVATDDMPREEASREPDGSKSSSSKEFGILIHSALEVWAPGQGTAEAEAEAAVRAALARHPELGGLAGEAVALLGRALPDPALEPVRAALTGRSGRVRREVPFLAPEGDRVLSGTIDVLLEEPDGSLLVLDWKTGHPPMATAKAQADTYARAVERLTGQAPRETRFLLLGSDPVGAVSIPGPPAAAPSRERPESAGPTPASEEVSDPL